MSLIDKILENNDVYEIGTFNLEDLAANFTDLVSEETVAHNVNLGGKMTKVKISVYGKEGPVPHFHIHYDGSEKDKKKVMPDGDCCIKICEPGYFSHGEHKGTLNNDQAKVLNALLKTNYKKDESISIWRAIWLAWYNNVNHDIKECNQPDYTLLNK